MPRNNRGLIRSSEHMKANPGAAPALHHMRVHMADSDGAVKVTHHASPAAAPHAEHNLKGDELANHIMEHSGAEYGSEGGGEHYSDEGDKTSA